MRKSCKVYHRKLGKEYLEAKRNMDDFDHTVMYEGSYRNRLFEVIATNAFKHFLKDAGIEEL